MGSRVGNVYNILGGWGSLVRLPFFFFMLISVETEYHEMLFRVKTEHSDKELYQIIAQSRHVQMISY